MLLPTQRAQVIAALPVGAEQKGGSGLCKMKNRSWEGSGIAKSCAERISSLSFKLGPEIF